MFSFGIGILEIMLFTAILVKKNIYHGNFFVYFRNKITGFIIHDKSEDGKGICQVFYFEIIDLR